MLFPRKPRIIYNDDSCSLRLVPPPHSEKSIAIPVNYLKGTQVDVLCFCVAEEIASGWPSQVIESIYDIYRNDTTGAFAVQKAQDAMWTLHQRGVDYLPILIRNARKNKIAFYASFRMNDTHHKSEPEGILAPKFWKENQHLRLWGVADAKSYYNAGLDYAYPQVRRRKTDSIRELAETYDIDGIELDFCRSPYFFQPSQAWAKRRILTDFVAEIREDLHRIGRQRSRPVGLIVRVPIDADRLTAAGIDAAKWIDKKLMDVLVMSHLTNNYNQSITPWRERCRGKGILFYPSVEAGPAFNDADMYSILSNPLAPAHNFGVRVDPDSRVRMHRSMARNYWGQDVDGIYMFNYPCALFGGRSIIFNDKPVFRKITAVLSELGQVKTLAGKDKKYVFYKDLPLYVEAGRPPQFHQTIRFNVYEDNLAAARLTLRFRQIACRNPHAPGQYRQNTVVPPGLLNYYLNGEEIDPGCMRRTGQPAGRIPSGFTLKRHEQIEITLPGSRLNRGENALAFAIPHFPRDRDPYVFIYELEVETKFQSERKDQ